MSKFINHNFFHSLIILDVYIHVPNFSLHLVPQNACLKRLCSGKFQGGKESRTFVSKCKPPISYMGL